MEKRKTMWLASENRGKISEFRKLFAPENIEVCSLLDLNNGKYNINRDIHDSNSDDSQKSNITKLQIEENGSTFEDNALIKAKALYDLVHDPVLADDSGLCVDALDGKPGIYSGRFAGSQKNDQDNIDKLLEELHGVKSEDRTARFVCVMAFIDKKGKEHLVRGTVEGIILDHQKGTNGFGYDPVFYLPDLTKTMAELNQDQKNQISHRGNALKQIKTIITDNLNW